MEVLVSASIIAILTVIGVVSYSSVNKRSRDVKRKSDMEQLRSALEMYRTGSSAYPNPNGDGVFVPVSQLSATLVSGNYMPAIPSDPGAYGYWYQAIPTSGVYNSYCICGKLESIAGGSEQSTCTVSLDSGTTGCNYGIKNP